MLIQHLKEPETDNFLFPESHGRGAPARSMQLNPRGPGARAGIKRDGGLGTK